MTHQLLQQSAEEDRTHRCSVAGCSRSCLDKLRWDQLYRLSEKLAMSSKIGASRSAQMSKGRAHPEALVKTLHSSPHKGDAMTSALDRRS